MGEARVLSSEEEAVLAAGQIPDLVDGDPAETEEWLNSLDYVLKSKGPERVKYLLQEI
jgi:pyruvate dehydrogenase E1 component